MPVSAFTFAAGDVPTATQANRMGEAAQPWTAYTPTIANVTTSSATARYHRHGDKVTVEFEFTLSAGPTGVVSLSLPVTAAANFTLGQVSAVRGFIGGVRTAVSNHTGFIYLESTTTVQFITPGSTGQQWASAIPVTWASPDTWGGTFTYEAA